MATDLTVANTILEQLGGTGILKLMCGCSGFVGDTDSVSFKVGKNAKGVIACRIQLLPSDTYKVTFYGRTYAVKSEHTDVYVDVLRELFERETGMYLTFVPRKRS